MVGGLTMIIMAVAVVVLITTGARWLLTARYAPPAPVQSGPLPKALADEIKRNEQAYYLRGMNDAVEFWRLTGSSRTRLCYETHYGHGIWLPLTPSRHRRPTAYSSASTPQQSLDCRLTIVRIVAQRIWLSWTCRGDPKIEWSCLMDRLLPYSRIHCRNQEEGRDMADQRRLLFHSTFPMCVCFGPN